MRKLLLLALAGVIGASALLLINTCRLQSYQVAPFEVAVLPVDADAAAQRLAGALRIATVSAQDPSPDSDATFSALHEYLRTSFPRVHAQLELDLVSHSLLFRWPGSDPSLDPILLLAHQDVVPAENEAGWTHPPFEGAIDGGFVWGRGAMDFKNGLMGILEAVEHLLAAGFAPRRTMYLSFGHDEEVGGRAGAKIIVEKLAGLRRSFHLILDEGLAITDGIVPGLSQPVALIGVTEKGYTTLALSVEREGGHSSMPPAHTTLGELSAALVALESSPMPASLSPPARALFGALAPHMNLPQRLVFANLWLTEPLVIRSLANKPSTNALIRTTTAVTMASGSSKENVLPRRAEARVNFRILPGDTVQSVLAHAQQVVGPGVQVQAAGFDNIDPSPVSAMEGAVFERLQGVIRGVYPQALVAPSLVLSATDARHYTALSQHVYRFTPMVIRPDDTQRVHGVDERQSIADYARGVQFYIALLRAFDGS